MILHVVLFKPQESLSIERRRAMLDAVVESVQRCPTVRACRIGRRIRHGLPGYEQAMTSDYQYAMVLEFETVQGLTEYLRDPEHERLGAVFSSGSLALAYDYELLPVADLRQQSP